MTVAALNGFLQFVVDGFISGTMYGLIGLSFGLIVAVTGRFHFAWAISFALTGYVAAYLVNQAGVPVGPAMLIGLTAGAAFSVLLELYLYRPVAARSGSHSLLAVFAASFGVTIAGVNLIPIIVRHRSYSETLDWISFESQSVGGITFTSLDIVTVATLWLCAVITWAVLRFMPLGRQIEAVRVNPVMAEAVGIRPERTYVIVFLIGSLLGGIAALLFAMRFSASPDMGLTPVFYAFVVAFLAGLGRSPLWIMLVGTALGVAEGISAVFFSPAWQRVVVFGILLGLLVVKAAHAWRPTLFRLPTTLTR